MDAFRMGGLQRSLRPDSRPEYQEAFKGILMDGGAVSFNYREDNHGTSVIVGFETKVEAQSTVRYLPNLEPEYLGVSHATGNYPLSPNRPTMYHPPAEGFDRFLPTDVFRPNLVRGGIQSGHPPCLECGMPARVSCELCRELFCSRECSNEGERHSKFCTPKLPTIPRELPATPRDYQAVSRVSAPLALPPGPYGVQPPPAVAGNPPLPFVGPNWSGPQQHRQMTAPPGHQQQNQMPPWGPAQQAYSGHHGFHPPPPQPNDTIHPETRNGPALGPGGNQGPSNRSNYQRPPQQQTGARPRQQVDQSSNQDGDSRPIRQFREGNQEHCNQSGGQRDDFRPGIRSPDRGGRPYQQQQHGYQSHQTQTASHRKALLTDPVSPPKNKESFDKPRPADDANAFRFRPRDRQYDGGNTRQNNSIDKSFGGGIQSKFNKGPERTQQYRGNFNTSPRKPESSGRSENWNNFGDRAKPSADQSVRGRTGVSVPEEWDQDESSVPVSYGSIYTKGTVSLPGGLVEVTLTWICSPEEIFVQINSLQADLDAINSKLAASVDRAPLVQGAVVGLPCAAPYEGTWFRGLVRKVFEDGSLAVFFVDYGNTAQISRGSVKQLEQSLCAAPFYAIELKLTNVQPVQDKWELNVSNFVADQVAGKNLTVKMVEKKQDGKLIVDLLVDGKKSLGGILVAEGLARSTESQSTGLSVAAGLPHKSSATSASEPATAATITSSPATNTAVVPAKEVPRINQERAVVPGKAWVGVVVSASDIRVQCLIKEVEQDAAQVTEVLEEAGLADKPLLSRPVEVGEFYACLFEDGVWYRAQVKEKTCDKLQVYLIDFGNDYETSVRKLRALPPELLDIAPCCSKLHLNRVEAVPDAAAAQVNAILEPLVDQYVDVKTVVKQTGAVAVVEVEHSSASINDAVLEVISSLPAKTAAEPVAAPVAAAAPAAEVAAPEPKLEADAPPYIGEEWTCVKAIYKPSETANLPLNQQVEIVILNGSEAPFFIHFCVFNADFFEKLAELHAEIHDYCKMPLPSHKPEPYEVCLVEHPEDKGGWGRGCRVDKDDETFFYLLDKGEGVIVRPDRVRRIPGKFLALPYAAHAGVLKGYGDVNEEDTDQGVVSKLKTVLKSGTLVEATISYASPWVLDIPEATAALSGDVNK